MFTIEIQGGRARYATPQASTRTNTIEVSSTDQIIAGSVNANLVSFIFDAAFSVEGMQRYAIFRSKSGPAYKCSLKDDTCYVPWELCTSPGIEIFVGAIGILKSDTEPVLIGTTMTSLGTVVEGAITCRDASNVISAQDDLLRVELTSMEEWEALSDAEKSANVLYSIPEGSADTV